MNALHIALVGHLLLIGSTLGSEVKKDDKMLIMLEIEPIKSEDRSKRASVGEALRQGRQTPEVPSEYLGLLQQLAAQQQQQQQQQQVSASAQQPQHYIQQLVVSRDGARQPTAARYVLSQDGRLLEESGLAAFGQAQQLPPDFAQQLGQPQQLPQALSQPPQFGRSQQLGQQQQLGLPVYQPDPLQQTQPLQIPAAPTQPVRPGQRPQISEFARQQQRILQEVRDAPLRAQIAGLTTRQPPRRVQPVPTGPNSQSPQIFIPPTNQPPEQPQQSQQLQQPQQLQQLQQPQQPQQPQQLQQTPQGPQFALPPQFQDPQNPNIVYTPVPVDPQTYFQQQLASQFDPSQIYGQAQRGGAVSQQLIYQQPIQQEIAQDKIRRPITVLPSPSSAQPQLVQQNIPQQYLIETSKPSSPQPQQPQYQSSDAAPQFQYVQQAVQQPVQQPAEQQSSPPVRQPEVQPSTLLQPVAGRGLFGPIKPSRSSIFVSRSSTPKSVSLTITDDITSEKVPVVRLPSPTGQRPLSNQELDALVSAGYSVTPIQDQYLKSKRQQPLTEERRNLVVYENHQDGVQYEYSPGSSDATATIKTKKSVPNSEFFKTD